MVVHAPGPRGRRPGRRASAWRLVVLLVCGWALLLAPGCRGCLRSAEKTEEELKKEEEERLKKLEEEKKPPFEFGHLLSEPSEAKVDRCWCKPGHWTAIMLAAKANDSDLDGQLGLSVVDPSGNQPIGLQGTTYWLSAVRPAILPKGQPKTLEGFFFVPSVFNQARAVARLADRRSGRLLHETSDVIGRMPPYQYHFVVLARLPGSYGYLKDLLCFRYPGDLEWSAPNLNYYRLVMLPGDQAVNFPSYGLFWTSIAFILWDDADAGKLTLERQVALLDWLHWGGQLIVSGPVSLEGLQGSFLSPYLPATSPGGRRLTAEDLRPLSELWGNRGSSVHELLPVQAWPGVKLELANHPDARYLPGTGNLVAERRVGRGRIVVFAFPLTGRDLTGWRGFDGFFNACLLGRPPRHFYATNLQLKVTWADAAGASEGERSQARFATDRTCKLRYFTRDTNRLADAAAARSWQITPGPLAGGVAGELDEAERYSPDAAAWDDFNGVAQAARSALQNAARIEVPDAKFVLWVLAGYLLVLVPLNWAFFRMVGRVEWAWAAAPVIAVVCTIVVIRLARLDIGFARLSTEIAVVELQGDYPRAHVTRYTALYTSLTTRYRVALADPGGLVQPFPTAQSPGAPIRPKYALEYRHGTEVALHGFEVGSNVTSLLHSEQTVDLGGPISLVETSGGEFQLTNSTRYTLRGVGLLRKQPVPGGDGRPMGGSRPIGVGVRPAPPCEAAWLDTIEPGATLLVQFRLAAEKPWLEARNRSPQTSDTPTQGELNLHGLTQIAESAADLDEGEIRLVGWLEEEIPGQTIAPAAPQARRLAMVVAHLRYGPATDPSPDLNAPEDVPLKDFPPLPPRKAIP